MNLISEKAVGTVFHGERHIMTALCNLDTFRSNLDVIDVVDVILRTKLTKISSDMLKPCPCVSIS